MSDDTSAYGLSQKNRRKSVSSLNDLYDSFNANSALSIMARAAGRLRHFPDLDFGISSITSAKQLARSFGYDMGALRSSYEDIFRPSSVFTSILEQNARLNESLLNQTWQQVLNAQGSLTSALGSIDTSVLGIVSSEIDRSAKRYAESMSIINSSSIQRLLQHQSAAALANERIRKSFDFAITRQHLDGLAQLIPFEPSEEWEGRNFSDLVEEIPAQAPKSENAESALLIFIAALISSIDLRNLESADETDKAVAKAQIVNFIFTLLMALSSKEPKTSIEMCLIPEGCIIRELPTRKSERKYAISEKTGVEIIEERHNWVKTRYIHPSLGFQEGWIKRSLLSEKGSRLSTLKIPLSGITDK